jgi:hypothetical protein
MGWLSNRLPTACGLALERGASLSGLAVAWLERGATPADPELGMPATVSILDDGLGAC